MLPLQFGDPETELLAATYYSTSVTGKFIRTPGVQHFDSIPHLVRLLSEANGPAGLEPLRAMMGAHTRRMLRGMRDFWRGALVRLLHRG